MKWRNQLSGSPVWAGAISNREAKEQAAVKVSRLVEDQQVIGVGSGSTAYIALEKIGERIKDEGLDVYAVPTSKEAEMNCALFGLKTTTLTAAKPDWGFDGADEVDNAGRLIKGRGGALFAEKLVMASSPKTYILVDESKYVRKLGEKYAVPVEVDPRAVHLVETKLQDFPCEDIQLRMAAAKDGPVLTEAGNLLLEVRFSDIHDGLEKELSAIPGVIETGLFIGYPVEILTV
ncbi:ribose 5-phosphate isomerase A [Halobacillus litoralis]|uniref:Ribose 5-phosphate isomerase A n=1 Tax=Halobacillus litoralis TaxID=45668 RepID=A0A845DRX2_9BACI|nr:MULTISPECIES: ribose 5-phosphate isomerase A [Halobacillus]MYL20371.1 ribose 5-phosphate isomerase A [Halobacillus litoralis]MYL29465.1 ribose 5-phosphate isomerase A [Halobacillus halophilus]